MGLLGWIRGADINEGVKEFNQTRGAVLIDVRTGDEYRGGHIPGSVCVPLQFLSMKISEYVSDPDTPLFVYCQSGSRSAQATSVLKKMGYKNVKNIGGIGNYKGPRE